MKKKIELWTRIASIITCIIFLSILSFTLVSANDDCRASMGKKVKINAAANNHISDESRGLLKKLVEVNSGTNNLAGQEKIRELLIPEFRKLGFVENIHVSKKGRKVLSFKIPGTEPTILYMGHMDTVFPEETKFKHYTDKGDRIYGPGIIDMKGGIVLMLDILKSVGPDLRKHVLIVLNDDEEIGSFESKSLYIPIVKNIHHALVFEPGLEDGAFISSQSGVKWLSLEVTGRSAHAGLEPELGVNACVELAKKMVAINDLTDYSKKLTINIGVISGGSKPNVVCENARAGIDIRYVEPQDLNAAINKIEKITNTSFLFSKKYNEPTKAILTPVVELPSLKPASTLEMVKIVRQVSENLGIEFHHQHVGYGSDGNHLSVLPQGIHILVGLGPYGKGMHTDTEYMLTKSYAERLVLNIALLEKLAR